VDDRPTFWLQYGPYLAFGTALTAMLGSLYYSEIVGFVPCTLCWYQRILMYPLVLITLVGIVKQDRSLPDYVLPLSVIGMGFSTYHYLRSALRELPGICDHPLHGPHRLCHHHDYHGHLQMGRQGCRPRGP
jgi:disulfide bond formation protein DsbB